ncbi:MAG TPA: L-serine ammonia-lyase, iron-sulfur-dependent, subunit alpha [Clostridiales bacterium]|nr:L-serine ammonia-lyase, iron-sulfur-dependent, subunit alpha [Clostridiales bacterium]
MSLLEKTYSEYVQILKEELVLALGCTEPTCIAYVCAKARQVLGEFPEEVVVESSGNIIKNVKGVIVPNTGNLRGIDAAAIIGIVGGDPDKELEVLTGIEQKDIDKAAELMKKNFCKVRLLKTKANLHVIARVKSENHSAMVEIVHTHTNIVRIEKDGELLFKKDYDCSKCNDGLTDRSGLNVKDILEFADTFELDDLKGIILQQINYNSRISQEGLNHLYGAGVGANLIKHYGCDIKVVARAAAAAGSDARMSGCILPVVINSGSGNQGMTVSLPVIEFAKHLGASEEKLIRALVLSNLVAIHQKTAIGRLSAYCGAVSAACGSGAGITYLHGGTYDQICKTITNTLANVAGIVCDGAKPSCAAKIASAVDAAIMAHYLSMENECFRPGEGLVKGDVEETISSIGRLGRDGMRETDREILKIMVEG